MLSFLIKRLVLMVPTMFGAAVVAFVLLRIVPGDPISMMIPPGASEADIERLRVLYGLDRGIAAQFAIWLTSLMGGDFGTSISLRQDVLLLIGQRLPATLELCLLAALIAAALGFSIAIAGVWWRHRAAETVSDEFAGLLMAVPDFIWALLFILTLGVLWPVLPISGRIDPRIDHGLASQFYMFESLFRFRFDIFSDTVSHMILPAAALALPLTASIARLLKTSLLEALAQDYIAMARARGYSKFRVILVEALRNALVPTITLSVVQLTFLVGGTVLIERIFSFPGIGSLAIGAVIERDLPLIQGLILTFALMFMTLNLLIDILCIELDPRRHHG